MHLQTLVEAGNTVVAVELDMRVIAADDRVIGLGPGAGDAGGTVVAAGTPEHVADKGVGASAGYLAAAMHVATNVTSVSLCDVQITQRHTRRFRGLRRGA